MIAKRMINNTAAPMEGVYVYATQFSKDILEDESVGLPHLRVLLNEQID
jgi:hypothetical protein